MATNSTPPSVTEQVTESAIVTVRVPRNTAGTLFESAQERLERIESIMNVTLTDSGSLSPRNGATYVTVTAELTVTGVTVPEDIVEILENTVCVETVEITAAT